MNKITTNGNSVTFEREDGHIDVVEKGQYYIHINSDTVNFILIPRTDRGGVALFSSTMSNLTVNGKTYSEDEWKDGTATSDLSTNDGLSYKVVDELPETGDKGVVYLVKAEEEEENNKYIEYIYVDDAYEILGSFNTDIDLTQFYTKEESDERYATKDDVKNLNIVSTDGSIAVTKSDDGIDVSTNYVKVFGNNEENNNNFLIKTTATETKILPLFYNSGNEYQTYIFGNSTVYEFQGYQGEKTGTVVWNQNETDECYFKLDMTYRARITFDFDNETIKFESLSGYDFSMICSGMSLKTNDDTVYLDSKTEFTLHKGDVLTMSGMDFFINVNNNVSFTNADLFNWVYEQTTTTRYDLAYAVINGHENQLAYQDGVNNKANKNEALSANRRPRNDGDYDSMYNLDNSVSSYMRLRHINGESIIGKTNLELATPEQLDTKLNVADTLSEEEINEIMK